MTHPPIGRRQAVRLDSPRCSSRPTLAAARLADVLKRHPARHGPVAWRSGPALHAGSGRRRDDLASPTNRHRVSYCCGTAKWSHDGTRIVFDATPGTRVANVSRLMAIEVRDGRPTFTDLGRRQLPDLFPDDKRIAFLLNRGARAGGRGRRVGDACRRLGAASRRRLVRGSLLVPRRPRIPDQCDSRAHWDATVHQPRDQGGGHRRGPRTPDLLVAELGRTRDAGVGPRQRGEEGDSIALLDVRKPAEAKIIEVLWKRSADLDVIPRWPVYRPETGHCYLRRRGADEADALLGPARRIPASEAGGASGIRRSRSGS